MPNIVLHTALYQNLMMDFDQRLGFPPNSFSGDLDLVGGQSAGADMVNLGGHSPGQDDSEY